MTHRRRTSEAALVRAARRGSEDAVAELFARHWSPAHRAALLVTGDAAAAEDIAQEAFVAALRALERFDLQRPLRPWLHRIVVLAYVDRRERVHFVAIDSGRRLWRTRPMPGVTELAWAPNGRRLHAVVGGQLYAFDPRRRVTSSWIADWALGAAYRVERIAVAPGRLAVVRAARSGRREVRLTRGSRERLLFTARGPLPGIAWSPDGRRLLVPWPGADQWLFLRPRGGRTVAVGNIARQFMPGTAVPAFPETVQWCCARP